MKIIETITINPSSISIVEGTGYNDLVVQIEPNDADNQDLLWTSDDPEIASVNPELGFIYANKDGTTTIHATATDGSGASASCTVTVEPRISIQAITLNKTAMTIGKGETWSLSADICPANAFDKSLDWCSTNCTVADVDNNGIVVGKSIGLTEIRATARDGSGVEASCFVRVTQTSTCSVYETPKNSAKSAYLAVPVDVYSGAHRLKHELLKLFGGQNLTFSIGYNSTRLAKGDVGMGWYHNYEKNIVHVGNIAQVYSTPTEYSLYTATSMCSKEFTCSSIDKEGYVLTIHDSGAYRYILDCNSQRKEYYDCEGRLVKVVDRQGFVTTIEHTCCLMTITDTLTNKKIYVEQDAYCRIKRIYDDAARQVLLDYEGSLLTSITDANGNTFKYTYDSSNLIQTGTDPENVQFFVNTYDSDGRLVAQSDALGRTFVFAYEGDERIVTDREGKQSIRTFNSSGLLTKHIDENKNMTTYRYDDHYNIIAEADGKNNYVVKEYNRFNMPTMVRDKNGNETVFEYDSRGNITKVIYPCICNDCSIESYQYNDRNQVIKYIDVRGTATVYTYDENGLLLTKKVGTRPAEEYSYVGGFLSSKKDARGNETKFTYNAYGMVETVTNAENKVTSYVYDKLGHVKSITDANGKTVTTTYNKNYQKLSVCDQNGNVTEFSYNALMLNDKVTLPDRHSIQYEFDKEERVITVIDQLNQKTETGYDAGGRVVSKKFPDGATVKYEYDCVGNVHKEINPKNAVVNKTHDNVGNVLTVTDNAQNTTTYEYNEQSKPVKVTNANNGCIRYEYNKAGDVIAETDALNNRKTFQYDEYGNLKKMTDAKGYTTEYTYDECGNCLTVKNALNEVITYAYNSLNQCSSITDAKGNTVSFEYDALGRRTAVVDARQNRFTTEYDACGNVLKTIDPDGNVITETQYNELNLPRVSTDATGRTMSFSYNVLGKINTVTDAQGNHRTFAYDVCGRNNTVTDDLGGVSSAEYDLLGNVTKLCGPLGGATEYVYDDMGRLMSESTTSNGMIRYQYNELNLRWILINARGQLVNFSYDLNGRIKTFSTPEDVVSFDYDDNGNILRTRDSHGDTTRIFDELNRVISVTDVCGNTIGYGYDTVGNLERITYPDNTEVRYEYDENHNLVKVTDWAGRVTEYTYDKNNRVIGIVKPNGTVVTTTYERNKVKTTVERTAAGQVITGFEYVYDNLSRIIEEKVLANATKICYTYDDLSRVTNRTIKSLVDDSVITTETFSYDSAGNITDAQDGTFQYDTNNRLVVFNGQDVIYDADGNMLSNGSLCCGYDSLNRLIYAGDHDYIYNAEGVRIRNLCTDEDTSYVYDTNCKLSQLLVKTTNGVTTKYVYGLGLIGEEVNNTFKTYHFDSRGSTIAITDMSGNITDTFAYDTYGKLIARTGESDVIFGYNGRDGVVTDKNRLIYMRARYYSPDMHRFVNADIIHGKINNAVTLNRYAYANANPVMFIDPTGRIGIAAVALLGLAVVGLTVLLSSCSSEKQTNNSNGVSNSDSNKNESEDSDAASEDNSWADEDPFLSIGRYKTEEEAVLANYEDILEQARNDDEERGYVVYELYGGYYVSMPQGGKNSTSQGVNIDTSDIPSGAKAVATIHTHPYWNKELIYRPSEFFDVVEDERSSYVIDVNGNMYVLDKYAENHMDYDRLIVVDP